MDQTELTVRQSQQVSLIRQVFAYAHRFRGRTFVIHVDQSGLSSSLQSGLIQDLVLLGQAGIRIVLVPGARQRIDEVLERYQVQWERRGGVRIVSAAAIPFIKMAAFDVCNRFMTLLSERQATAVVGNWVRARSLGVIDGVDYQHAGRVERVLVEQVQAVMEQGLIPIFPCIGWNQSGKPYNISSRELAYQIAVRMSADKLFFVTSDRGIVAGDFDLPDGIEVEPDGRVSRLTVEEAGTFLQRNGVTVLDDGAVPSGHHGGLRDRLEVLRLSYLAARAGVGRVQFVDGAIPGVVLLEVFSDLGAGTMVHANTYQSIRAMREDEVHAVLELLAPLVERRVLVERSAEEIAAGYRDYVVYETDGRLYGCAALHRYGEQDAEIAAVAVDSGYGQLGIGRKLVQFLLQRAAESGVQSVFVLTTITRDWFEGLGFEQVPLDRLPLDKRRNYNANRNSIVLRYAVPQSAVDT